MNFEIAGVWPYNKGAVLMLEAIRSRLSAEFPSAKFAVPFSWPVEERLALGLWSTRARSTENLTKTALLDWCPTRLTRQLGFLPSREVDVFLDASGFAYGDFWGIAKLRERLARGLGNWKKGGGKAVLLPQALGPFEQPGMAETFRSAIHHLDLTFIRDSRSLSYAKAAAPDYRRFYRAPDFTNLLKPELPHRLEHIRGKVAIIPNEKIVSGRGFERRGAYLHFLSSAIEVIRASGREFFILIHEGAEDRALASELNGQLQRPIPVVDESSALTTKAIISAAGLVVSSRYHGLVSALSSGVPSLACGWSHKYGELMADYGCSQFNVDLQDPHRWRAQAEAFVEEAETNSFRAELRVRGDVERAKSEAMWQQVLELIR